MDTRYTCIEISEQKHVEENFSCRPLGQYFQHKYNPGIQPNFYNGFYSAKPVSNYLRFRGFFDNDKVLIHIPRKLPVERSLLSPKTPIWPRESKRVLFE